MPEGDTTTTPAPTSAENPPTVPAPPESGGQGNQGEGNQGNAPKKRAPRKPSQQLGKAAQVGSAASGAASGVANLPAGPVKNAAQSVASAPAPGGLLLLLALLLLLLFAIVPVNGGKTRLQLLWETINGKMALPGVLTRQQQLAAQQQQGVVSSYAAAAASAAQAAAGQVRSVVQPPATSGIAGSYSSAEQAAQAAAAGVGGAGFDFSLPTTGWDGLAAAGPEDY